MTLIALDIGNTRIGVGLFSQGKGLDPAQRIARDQWETTLPPLLKAMAKQAPEKIEGGIIASVAPPLNGQVRRMVKEAIGLEPEFAGTDLSIPLKTSLTDAKTVGVDRLLAALCTYVNTERANVIISAGTALVVDCVDETGQFLGGAIAPGLRLSARALHEWTAQLPLASLDLPTEFAGRSTMEALNLGLYAAARGGVRELIERYAEHLESWPHVVATGGDAQRLLADSGLVDSFIPDLVLLGAALVWEHHHGQMDD